MAHMQTEKPRPPLKVYSRIAGFLYLIIIVGGISGASFVRDRIIVPGDASATAEKIMASEGLWRIAAAGEIAMLVFALIVWFVLYALFWPVNRNVALLAVSFNLVSVALEAGNELNLLAPLRLLESGESLKAFTPQQLHILAYLPLRAYEHGFGVSLIFFGCACICLGYLIFKSGYLPKIIGILMQAAGLSYLIGSFAMILSPSLASHLFPLILAPALVGEGALSLWLLIKGGDAPYARPQH